MVTNTPIRFGIIGAAGQRRNLVFSAEVDVDARHLAVQADFAQRRAELSDGLVAVDVGCDQESRAGHGREGNPHEQLRVVSDARARSGLGPGKIEDELAFTVGLEVGGAGGDQALAVPGE